MLPSTLVMQDRMRPLKIGLVGTGHLGRIHAKCLALLKEEIEVVGIYDLDATAVAKTAETHGWHVCKTYEELLARSEAIDIVTPTSSHFVLAKAALEKGCHVFIEKPVTETLAEADELVALATKTGLVVQVGHVERFNPAFQAVKDEELDPVFIEAHRLALFNPRSTDVSVVLDLMIHDLDIVLTLIPSKLEKVSASGVGVAGESVDIANARLDFANGVTANLTASRISLKNMRKIRLFQRDAYISLDMLDKKAEVVRLHDHDPENPGLLQLPTSEGLREVVAFYPEIEPINAIQEELRSFANSAISGSPIVVDLAAGRRALDVAYQILEDIELRRNKYKSQQA